MPSKSTKDAGSLPENTRILVAVYPSEEQADRVVKRLSESDFPMDQISILGRIHTAGDDPLGIYDLKLGDRVKTWGKHGAFWGGLWSMVAVAAGFFIIPSVGALAAAGYMVEVIAGGSVVGAGAMAGAAAISQLAVAFHRIGIPEESILALHKAIEDGKYVLMLRGPGAEIAGWRDTLDAGNPLDIHDFPYARVIDLV